MPTHSTIKNLRVRCSVITPPGEGGIGVILLCGRGAAEVLGTCFEGTQRGAAGITPGRMAHGRIMQNGAAVDEVVVAHSAAQEAPVGETCYEVNCHGGAVAVKTVVECFRDGGAQVVPWRELVRPCGPARRLPLSSRSIRASALSSLPEAETRSAVKMLLHQADGALSREIAAVTGGLKNGSDDAQERLWRLVRGAEAGLAMLDPPKVMLAGPPNAGKSTLLNTLLRRERVIVHHLPGTTRDVVKDRLAIGGMPFDIMDSAGIRSGIDALEAVAVDNTLRLMGEAGTIFFLFDIRDDPSVVLESSASLPPGEARILYVANKTDLLDAEAPEVDCAPLPHRAPVVCISAKKQEGIGKLEQFLLAPYADTLSLITAGGPAVFTRTQREILATALRLAEEGRRSAAAHLLTGSGAQDNVGQ